MRRLEHGRRPRDAGFSLIELMVVVLIIAILIAIAVPTFLGARLRAQDRAAQSDLRNAFTAAKVYYAGARSYVVTAPQLQAIEPALAFNATIANSSAAVIGFTGTVNEIVLAHQSGSGTWFCIRDNAFIPTAGTWYDTGAALVDVDTTAECDQGSW
jgi:type IV pilus assembly protein PilA